MIAQELKSRQRSYSQSCSSIDNTDDEVFIVVTNITSRNIH